MYTRQINSKKYKLRKNERYIHIVTILVVGWFFLYLTLICVNLKRQAFTYVHNIKNMLFLWEINFIEGFLAMFLPQFEAFSYYIIHNWRDTYNIFYQSTFLIPQQWCRCVAYCVVSGIVYIFFFILLQWSFSLKHYWNSHSLLELTKLCNGN